MTSETCTNLLGPNVLDLMAKGKRCAPILMTNVFLMNMINLLDLSDEYDKFIRPVCYL